MPTGQHYSCSCNITCSCIIRQKIKLKTGAIIRARRLQYKHTHSSNTLQQATTHAATSSSCLLHSFLQAPPYAYLRRVQNYPTIATKGRTAYYRLDTALLHNTLRRPCCQRRGWSSTRPFYSGPSRPLTYIQVLSVQMSRQPSAQTAVF